MSAARTSTAPGYALRRPDQREQDRLADADTGQRHQQAVDPHPGTTGRRHPVLERGEEVLVDTHRLLVAEGGQLGLRLEPLPLDHRVDQLGVPGGCLLYTSPSPRDGLLSRM